MRWSETTSRCKKKMFFKISLRFFFFFNHLFVCLRLLLILFIGTMNQEESDITLSMVTINKTNKVMLFVSS
jgi:hypothetical protein